MTRLLPAAVLALLASPAAAQQETRRLPPAEATTVLVDVVVRDGTGRPVTDLRAADFQVLEDGVAQVVETFVPPAVPAEGTTAPAPATSPDSPTPAAAGGPPSGPGGATMAFVFDRLSTEGRVAAQRAVREALRAWPAGDRAGVFSVESTLVVLQDFTTDAGPLLAAVDALATRAAQSGSRPLDAAQAATGRRLAANAAIATLVGMPTPPRTAPSVYAQAVILAHEASMARAIADAFDRLARDEAGQVTAHALLAIVDALRGVPGRKAVVLFSEGLFRTEANEERFRSVVHSANRGSVSVYAVEASGLQTRTYESMARAEIESAGALSMARQASGRDTGGGAFTRDLEAVEDTVRYHPRGSLDWISDATGGVFVRDTNDLAGALRRIESDSRSYYLLGYTPADARFDGRFRRIAVRVSRRDVEVRARSGYFAVRAQGPVLAHVAPALALLEAEKRPHAVEVHAGAWPFPSGEATARVPLVVSVAGPAVARLAGSAKARRLDVTLLARVRAADGRPVEAVSRRFGVDAARPGDLLLLRDVWLPPGRYTLEAVAYESGSGRAGVATSEVEVRDGREALDRPQLLLVRGALPASDAPVELDAGHPLLFGEVVLEPLAGEPLPRRPPRPLVFQLAAVSPAGLGGVGVAVEVRQGERSLTRSTTSWGPPEASGLLRRVAELPTDTLRAGAYEVRVTLTEGGKQRVLEAPFELTDRD